MAQPEPGSTNLTEDEVKTIRGVIPGLTVDAQQHNKIFKAVARLQSKIWFGNDGSWSPFLIGYGTPPQIVNTFISTSTPQPYVVIPGGCIPSDPAGCEDARGSLFRLNESDTWQNLGNYKLMFEQNLGMDVAGGFGFDNITLGVPGSGAPNIRHQVVAGIVAKDYFLSSWGLLPAPTNFSDLNTPVPSLLQSLKVANEILSLSWGYTAGSYQVSQVNKYGHGSLTLGGYDAARFEDNNISFVMAPDISRDLVVGLISIQTADGSNSLLPEPILMFLDSGVSHIWLPEEACQRFENAFDLTYKPDLNLYLVDDTVHEALLAQNATVAFTISNNLAISSKTNPVAIDIPYSSFDLKLTNNYPDNNATINYFPLHRATNSSQYTLGRTFFQNAYVIADYERSTFSVHSARFSAGNVQNLQLIFPVDAAVGGRMSTATIAGIVVGVVTTIIVVISLTVGIVLRKRRRYRAETDSTHLKPQDISELLGKPRQVDFELHGETLAKPELESAARLQHRELAAEEVATELGNGVQSRYEMQE